jgi:MoaA/NifB/PqqE/SkfB family radical SAM enzyme
MGNKFDLSEYTIILDSYCNQNCLFCVNSNFERKKIDLKEIYLICNKGINTNKKNIILSGGEPTLRNDLYKIVNYIKKNSSKRVIIYTNGMRLSNKQYTFSLKKVDNFIFSIHGPNSKVHDFITQVPGSFELSLKGIKNVREINIDVGLFYVITSLNQAGIIDFLKNLYGNYNIKNMAFAFPFCDGNVINNPYILPRISQFNKIIDEIQNTLKDIDIIIPNCVYLPICCLNKNFQMKIIENKREYSKNKFDYYNLNSKELKDDDEKENNFKKNFLKPIECKKCKINEICYGFWNIYVTQYGFDEVKPF